MTTRERFNQRISKDISLSQAARVVAETAVERDASTKWAPTDCKDANAFARWVGRVMEAHTMAAEASYRHDIVRGETPTPLGPERTTAASAAVSKFLAPAVGYGERVVSLLDLAPVVARNIVANILATGKSQDFKIDGARVAGDPRSFYFPRAALPVARRECLRHLPELERIEGLLEEVESFQANALPEITSRVKTALEKLGHEALAIGLHAAEPSPSVASPDVHDELAKLRALVLATPDQRQAEQVATAAAEQAERDAAIARARKVVEAAAEGNLQSLFQVEASMVAHPEHFPERAVHQVRGAVAAGLLAAGIGSFFEALAEALG